MNMEKKENEVEIATNMSSGAEKVENIGERADAKAGAAGAVNGASAPGAPGVGRLEAVGRIAAYVGPGGSRRGGGGS